jgi:hypothetical protein
MGAYTRHVNPFTRRYTVQQLYYVKMFVKADLCANVRTHGCGDGVNGTEAAMSPLLVRVCAGAPPPLRTRGALDLHTV